MKAASGAILIVDDDLSFRSLVASVVARAGFMAVQASSGEEAIEAATAERPTLVILDVRLPDVNGYEVCRELREGFGEDLPIIFISGERTDPLDRAAGMLVGGDDYLVKPFDPDELLASVRRLVEHAQGLRNTDWAPERRSELTKREQETLSLLAAGKRSGEIAAELEISEKTVSSHMQHVLMKLNVNTRAQAVAVAYREGLTKAAPATGVRSRRIVRR